MSNNHSTASACRALIITIVLLLAATMAGKRAQAGEDTGSAAAGTQSGNSDKAVVVPYETRPAPSHRISLNDGRVYFVSEIETTDNGFVLHTLEGETIDVDESEVAEIVEFEAD
ncbi:MAG TPA: hypothetical protein VK973_17325 [Arenicellales bacterium]|nr:hypothetical protein [Arenicellales bacterium]